MAERGHDHPERDADGPEDAGGADDQLRRALEQERHRRDARRFFEEAPLFRVQFEENGTVTLCKKEYKYWPGRPCAASTAWRPVSSHPDLEGAERRLRHITAPHVYYDERGRLAQAPSASGPDEAAPQGGRGERAR